MSLATMVNHYGIVLHLRNISFIARLVFGDYLKGFRGGSAYLSVYSHLIHEIGH